MSSNASNPIPFGLFSIRNLAFLLAMGTGLAFLAALYLSPSLLHDQAYCLYAAERMSEGLTIYSQDLMEPNPPLIFWFSLFVDKVAHLAHLPESMTLHLVTLALAVSSTWLCNRVLARSSPPFLPAKRLLLPVAIFFVEAVVFPGDLAQREQLLVLLLLPTLLVFAEDETTVFARSHLFLFGFLAGVAICFKPQQLTILIALQFGVLLRYGLRAFLRRREWIVVSGAFLACLLYVAAVRFLTPGYLLTVTPLLRNTYWALARYTFWQLMLTQHRFPQALFLITIIFFWGNRRKVLSAAPGFLLLAALGACVGYGIQHTGFEYHRIPQNAFLELALLWIAIELVAHYFPALFTSTKFSPLQVAAGALAFVAAFIWYTRASSVDIDSSLPPHTVQAFLRSLPPGTPVWSLSTDLSAHFPEVFIGHLVWASRFAHLWMLPAIQQNLFMHLGGPAPAKVLTPAMLTSLEAQQRQDSVEDLARWQPRFIFVPQCHVAGDCLGFDAPFDTLAWFQQSPPFAAAWSHYRYRDTLPNIHNGAIFDLYERK